MNAPISPTPSDDSAVDPGAAPAAARSSPDPEGPPTRGRARKYSQVMGQIYQAAIEVFAAHGLDGASTQAVADRAGLSKAQLHYYIDSKEALYRQVLQDIIDDWIGIFGFSDEAFGARKVLTEHIRRKMNFSFDQSARSRIFAAEMMRGAPVARLMMGNSKRRTQQAIAVIQNWVAQGQMGPVDPQLFLFHLWAVTQFYADHAAQVSYFREGSAETPRDRDYLIEQVTEFLLRGAQVK